MITAPGVALITSRHDTFLTSLAGFIMLALTWNVAIVGALYSIMKPRMYSRVEWQAFCMYTLTAAIPLLFTPWLYLGLAAFEFKLILSHFGFCALAGWVYGAQKCNWWPDICGYHEVFHVLSLCDMALMYQLTNLIAQRI